MLGTTLDTCNQPFTIVTYLVQQSIRSYWCRKRRYVLAKYTSLNIKLKSLSLTSAATQALRKDTKTGRCDSPQGRCYDTLDSSELRASSALKHIPPWEQIQKLWKEYLGPEA